MTDMEERFNHLVELAQSYSEEKVNKDQDTNAMHILFGDTGHSMIIIGFPDVPNGDMLAGAMRLLLRAQGIQQYILFSMAWTWETPGDVVAQERLGEITEEQSKAASVEKESVWLSGCPKGAKPRAYQAEVLREKDKIRLGGWTEISEVFGRLVITEW